jgi:hypothetical protein
MGMVVPPASAQSQSDFSPSGEVLDCVPSGRVFYLAQKSSEFRRGDPGAHVKHSFKELTQFFVTCQGWLPQKNVNPLQLNGRGFIRKQLNVELSREVTRAVEERYRVKGRTAIATPRTSGG